MTEHRWERPGGASEVHFVRRSLALLLSLIVSAGLFAGCSNDDEGGGASSNTSQQSGTLVVYSGRNENLIKPLIERFTAQTGVRTEVRYGDSAQMAAQILEEGGNTQADVFLSQDAGALGAVANQELFAALPEAELQKVAERYRAQNGEWLGVSGRARVIAYNPQRVSEADRPTSTNQLVQPRWKGRIGIAPTNASFQSFVTAMRETRGQNATRAWLAGIKSNEPRTYASNALVLDAVNRGEVDLGLVNHYYLPEKQKEDGAQNVIAQNLFLGNGDPGALVNVAGVGILDGSERRAEAERFVTYLTSVDAQTYFRDETFEYPLAAGVQPAPGLPPLDSIQGPQIDLGSLDSLSETQDVLREAGLI